ncbi:unnamed protein product [Colias eurytheme]|nr:unnamed protein product [Colias eurytheme]
MGGCSVLCCNSRTETKAGGISFHSFPTEPCIRKIWIDATGRQNWVPSKNARICSNHFDANFFVGKAKLCLLKSNAMPTINIPSMNVESVQSVSTTQNDDPIPSTSSRGVKRNGQKSNDQNMSPGVKTPKLTEKPINNSYRSKFRILQDVTAKLEKQKRISTYRLRKLRAVRESRRRLQIKVAKLENILVDLKSKMLINMEEAEDLIKI